MKELTAEWVSKADNDLEVARLARYRAEMPISDAICFHSQQCAEKYLKAFLQEHRIRFPYTHPLIPLLEMCLPLDQGFESLRVDLDRLDGYAVAARYPGVFVTIEMADEALEAASRVRDFIQTRLQSAADEHTSE
jgi:HEPN domain-containing protein